MSSSLSSSSSTTPSSCVSEQDAGSGSSDVLRSVYKQLVDIDVKLNDILQRLNDIDSDDEELALSEAEPPVYSRPGSQNSFGYSLARKPVSNFNGYRNNPFNDRYSHLKRSRTDFGPHPSFGPMSGPFCSPFNK